MGLKNAGIALLGLAWAVLGCGRKPLRNGEITIVPEAGVPVVDGATDATAIEDGSATSGFVMLDDMEDHPDRPVPGGLTSAFYWQSMTARGFGNWFVSLSGGSTSDVARALVDPPRGDSHGAREIRGGDNAPAANMWAQLDHPLGGAIDLRAYAGIVFWARLTGSGGILDVALDSLPGGGGVYFKSDFTQLPTWEFHVSERWQQFTIRFADWPAFPPGVVSIDFVVSGSAGPFDLWIDDVALVCRAACP